MTGIPNYLKRILDAKRKQLDENRAYWKSLMEAAQDETGKNYHVFREAIRQPGAINLIAEIKKASPSKGLIREDFDVLKIAKIYCEEGAAALSVLTETEFFLGKPAYLAKVADNVDRPVLMKDFFIDETQVYDAFRCGASAILLIVAVLSDAQLRNFLSVARGFDLDCCVEVHTEEELDRALTAGAEIIGVNNRDLKTFEVDLGVAERLIPRIPRDKVIVAESGLNSYDDVRRMQDSGAHAVLIGEAFMRSPDIRRKVREIMGKDVSDGRENADSV